MALNAWTTFPDHVADFIFAQIGIQTKDNHYPTAFIQTVAQCFELSIGPDHFDMSVYEDAESYTNYLFMAYWENIANYHTWLSHPEVKKWWSGNCIDEHGDIGFFSEVATIPTTHFETIHSRKNNDSGVTHFIDLKETKTHAYWGSMRDRLPIAPKNDRANGRQLKEQTKDTKRKRVKVVTPANICLIRTAQDWSHCSQEEKQTYLDLVQPALNKAHNYLDTKPEDSGCISVKYLQETDLSGDHLEKTCVVGFFLSLQHLEKWTHEHPTHKAVFGTYLEMVQRYNFNVDLSLWHEVSVLQPDDLELEYVNCHPKTGFMPFFTIYEQHPIG